MGSSFTVFFEGPFWVGILESSASAEAGTGAGRGYLVARHVFGAEPGNAELLAFMLNSFHLLMDPASCGESKTGKEEGFSQGPGSMPCLPRPGSQNPKRAQREARRDLGRPISTKAQARLSASREEGKAASKACRRERLSEAEELRFRLRAEKRKARHRGH